MAKSDEQKEEINAKKEEVGRYAALQSLKSSEGGQLIVKGSEEAVVESINKLRSAYKTAPDVELRALIAVLDARMTLLYSFLRVEKNLEISSDELHELLKSTG